jgi:Cof subfamily protein (haloacid dehalogenase superfamily)
MAADPAPGARRRIALVVSDVDGTLVTPDKRLTPASIAAVRDLAAAGIGFTITSSRPPFGMRMLVEPLALKLPLGGFNGGAIVTPALTMIRQTPIPPDAARQALAVLDDWQVSAWVFAGGKWLVRDADGPHVDHEHHTVQAEPTVVADFDAATAGAAKIVGVSDDHARLARCEAAMQAALAGAANASRSQPYYLDVTPPGIDKGTFVAAVAAELGIPTAAVAVIGDMTNDLPMFARGGFAVAMGNAPDEVKAKAGFVTSSNDDDGFAGAVAEIIRRAGAS